MSAASIITCSWQWKTLLGIFHRLGCGVFLYFFCLFAWFNVSVPSLTLQWCHFFAFLLHIYSRKILSEFDPWHNGMCKQLKIFTEADTIPFYFISYCQPFPSRSDNFLHLIFSFFLLPVLTPPKYCCKVPKRCEVIDKLEDFFFSYMDIYKERIINQIGTWLCKSPGIVWHL